MSERLVVSFTPAEGAVIRMLGLGGRTLCMSVVEAAAESGEGPANDTMGSNSRVRAKRARVDLAWRPKERSLIEEIERGCYVEAAADDKNST